MKKIYLILAILLVLTLVLVGCSSDNSEQESAITQKEPTTPVDAPIKEDPIAETKENPVVEVREYPDPMDNEIYSGELLELLQSKHYTVKMIAALDKNRQITIYDSTTVVDGDISASSTNNMGNNNVKITTILKEGKAYFINHLDKTMLVTPVKENKEKKGTTLDEIDFNKVDYLGKASGTFGNQARDFEEYRGDIGYIRFYYDGSELDGMEVITDDGKTLMNDLSFSDEVDESIFELPKDYTIIN